MLTKSRAIVLGTVRYGDNAVIAHLLTEEEGCTSFVVRIPKSRRSSGTYRLLQPLTLVETEWDLRPGSDRLAHPRQLRLHTPYASIPLDPQKTSIALFLAEFLNHALGSEPPSTELFHYTWGSLLWLDGAKSDYANFHLVFLLRLSRYLGFFPGIRSYVPGAYFDLESSTFSTTPPAHPHFLLPDDARHLPTLMRLRYATMRIFRLSGSERSRLLGLIVEYYRLHIPSFPELKSLSVLHDIFNT